MVEIRMLFFSSKVLSVCERNEKEIGKNPTPQQTNKTEQNQNKIKS